MTASHQRLESLERFAGRGQTLHFRRELPHRASARARLDCAPAAAFFRLNLALSHGLAEQLDLVAFFYDLPRDIGDQAVERDEEKFLRTIL